MNQHMSGLTLKKFGAHARTAGFKNNLIRVGEGVTSFLKFPFFTISFLLFFLGSHLIAVAKK